MNEKLLQKYFQDRRCSHEELEEVLGWFQSNEGRRFLQRDMDQKWEQPAEGGPSPVMSSSDREELFQRIQRHARKETPKRWSLWSCVAGIILILTVILSAFWWQGVFRVPKHKKTSPKITYKTYKTTANQQKVLTLSDGTTIRLNAHSSLKVPEVYKGNKRNVRLKGEAYFEVVHNPKRPFTVRAGAGRVEDLGTKFNVKVDSAAGKVQVAVKSGKVSLARKGQSDSSAQAILTAHHFGLLNTSSGQITIEQGSQRNYLSWMSGRLVFDGQNLASISRQLERIYSVKVQFQSKRLQKLNLTAVLKDTSLKSVLTAISHGLDIHYSIDNQQIIWER